ncbi:MAG: hypothetical protein AB8I08_29935 [Sandaracinaceae bacterium]
MRPLFIATVLSVLSFTTVVQAQTGVAIDLSGAGAGVAAREIEGVLEDHDELRAADDGPVRVTGRIRRSRLTLTATGPDGEIASAAFRGRNAGSLRRAIRNGFWEQLGVPIVSAMSEETDREPASEPVSAPSPEAADSDRPTSGSSDDGEPSESGPLERTTDVPDAFRASVSMGLYSRDFSYVDDLFLSLRGYSVAAVPMLRIRGDWHPLTHFSDELWASIIGVVVDAQLPFGLATEVGENLYPTYSFEWSLGARARLPIDQHAVAISAAYAERGFFITRQTPAQARVDVPDVHYHEVRLDAHVWFDLDVLAFAVRGGAAFVVETGQIEQVSWFRRNRSSGAGAGAEVHVPLAEGLNATLLFDWRGYFFDMNALPGDDRVAGGAIDHHISTSLGLSYRAR